MKRRVSEALLPFSRFCSRFHSVLLPACAVLLVLQLLVVSPAVSATEPNGPVEPVAKRLEQLRDRISQSDRRVGPRVFERFRQGQEKVKVIVRTRQPKSPSGMLNSPEGRAGVLNARETAIKQMLGRFDDVDVSRRQPLAIVSGFAAEVSLAGLEQLVEDEDIISVFEVRQRRPMLSQGIALADGSAVRDIPGAGGAGVSIAVLDSGIDYLHPDFGGSALPSNTKVIGGYDTGENDADPMDTLGHGTAVAGIAAGDIPVGDQGDYIGGVAPSAKLYALKITDVGGWADDTAILEAITWAVLHQLDDPANPILVINLSYGGGMFSGDCDEDPYEYVYADAAEFAEASGITIFASSGNDGYTTAMSSPACISKIVAVGEVYDADVGASGPWGIAGGTCTDDPTSADLVACYSNASPSLDFLAPGTNATVTDISGAGGYELTDYVPDFGGTSAAAPYAAGAGALLHSTYFSYTGSYLTPAGLRSALAVYGDDVVDPRNSTTYKRLNIHNSLHTGDINMDGDVGLKDAILALQVLTGVTPSESIYTVTEVNNNSRVGQEEAINALRQGAGL